MKIKVLTIWTIVLLFVGAIVFSLILLFHKNEEFVGSGSFYVCVGENLNSFTASSLVSSVEKDGGAGVFFEKTGSVVIFAYSKRDEAEKALKNIKTKYENCFVYDEPNVEFSKNKCKKIQQNDALFTLTNSIIENKSKMCEFYFKWEKGEIGQVQLQKFVLKQRDFFQKLSIEIERLGFCDLKCDVDFLLLYFDKFLSISPGEIDWKKAYQKACVMSHFSCHELLEKICACV